MRLSAEGAPQASMRRPVFERLSAAIRRLIQTRVWGMKIDPTAWIAPSALIDRTWPRGIRIGAGCYIDEEAVVLTHDLVRGVYMNTSIGDRSYIGPRAIVMPGVTVGSDCLVMPGALVTKDMAPFTTAEGNPARIRSRD